MFYKADHENLDYCSSIGYAKKTWFGNYFKAESNAFAERLDVGIER